MGRIAACVGVCAILCALTPGQAAAQKVLNPTTSLGATANSVGFGLHSGSAAIDYSAPASGTLFSGATVTADGSITVPMANVTIPTIPLPDINGTCGSGCTYSITGIMLHVLPVSDVTGTINPFTGAASLGGQFYVHVDLTECVTQSGFAPTCQTPTTCQFGSSTSPISVSLTTGTTTAPAGTSYYGPVSGTPYDETSGSQGLVDDTLVVPQASGCGSLYTYSFDSQISSYFGLPNNPGNAKLALTATLSPIIKQGVIAALTSNAVTGPAPLTVNFDASGTQAPAGVSSYAFDFNGDGTVDQTAASPTGTFTYTAPGTYTAKVLVTDKDGDSDAAIRTVVVTAPSSGTATSGGGGTTHSTPPAPPPMPTIVMAGKPSATISGGGYVIDDGQLIDCPSGASACDALVTATASAVGVRHAARAGRVVRVGTVRLTVSPGTSRHLRFRLNQTGARLLRSLHHLVLRVQVVLSVAGQAPRTYTSTITVRLPRRRR